MNRSLLVHRRIVAIRLPLVEPRFYSHGMMILLIARVALV